jgi:hypothetical protein
VKLPQVKLYVLFVQMVIPIIHLVVKLLHIIIPRPVIVRVGEIDHRAEQRDKITLGPSIDEGPSVPILGLIA